MGLKQIRVEVDSHVVICSSEYVLAFVEEGTAPVVVCNCIIRFQFDRPGQV